MTRIARAIALALAAAAGASPVFTQSAVAPTPSRIAPELGAEAGIAPVAGSHDGDLGIEGYASSTAAACVPVYAADASPVGPVLGDAEKDTMAYTVVATDCRWLGQGGFCDRATSGPGRHVRFLPPPSLKAAAAPGLGPARPTTVMVDGGSALHRWIPPPA